MVVIWRTFWHFNVIYSAKRNGHKVLLEKYEIIALPPRGLYLLTWEANYSFPLEMSTLADLFFFCICVQISEFPLKCSFVSAISDFWRQVAFLFSNICIFCLVPKTFLIIKVYLTKFTVVSKWYNAFHFNIQFEFQKRPNSQQWCMYLQVIDN